MNEPFTISHATYLGSTDADGYPTGDNYGTPVSRKAMGWYPLSSQLSQAMEYDRRVTTSKVLMVKDVSAYSPRDIVVLPGSEPEAERTYFVSQDVRDYTTGPFEYRPGGEVVLEKVSG